MHQDILIKNPTLVNEGKSFVADVLLSGGLYVYSPPGILRFLPDLLKSFPQDLQIKKSRLFIFVERNIGMIERQIMDQFQRFGQLPYPMKLQIIQEFQLRF